MGARLRAHDWSRTPLGAPARWPQSLKTLVALMLASEHPMFMAWGPSQTWLYNDPFIPIMGDKHPQRLGLHALDQVWSEARTVLAPLFDRVFAGTPVQMDDFALELDRHGRLEEAHFAFSYTPARDESGQVAGLFGVCIETTALVLADRRRAAEQERQRLMFEQAPSFVCILEGPQHVFQFVNKAHRRLFNSATWIGKSVREAFPDIEGQGYFELLDQVYRTGRRYVAQSAPVRYRRSPEAAAEERLLDFIYEPMLDDAGRVVGIFCEGLDVTEARRAERTLRESEARLREADRRKDTFLATLAHELRNPLAPIVQATLIARSPGASEAQLAWCRKVIERQAGRMALLIDDLLDVSRITHGRLVLRRTAEWLDQIVDTAVETARPLFEARGHQLVLALPSPPLRLEADALRLSQVLANLLTNAAKYTDRGGRIELSAEVEAGCRLVITVRDNGIGIEPQMLPRLFEMFSQDQDVLQRAEGGLGIGLALVKGIIELHGGTVAAASPGPGQGSTFSVILPWTAPAEEQTLPLPTAVSANTSRRILIADDNRDAAETLKLLLEFDGHEVHLAADGDSALAAARAAVPEVMLLDIGMPGMNGYELARAIRAEPWGGRVKLVAITGWGQASDREQALRAGFDGHLTKPATHAALRAFLEPGS